MKWIIYNISMFLDASVRGKLNPTSLNYNNFGDWILKWVNYVRDTFQSEYVILNHHYKLIIILEGIILSAITVKFIDKKNYVLLLFCNRNIQKYSFCITSYSHFHKSLNIWLHGKQRIPFHYDPWVRCILMVLCYFTT